MTTTCAVDGCSSATKYINCQMNKWVCSKHVCPCATINKWIGWREEDCRGFEVRNGAINYCNMVSGEIELNDCVLGD